MQACETSPPHFAHLWLSYFGKGNYFLTIAQSSAGSPLAPFPVALPCRCRWHFPDGLSGSKLAISIPFAPVGPLRTAFPGSKSVILIPSALPASLSGSESAFPIPFAPLNPLRTAFPGSKPAFLSPQTLPASLSGSESAFPIPFAPLAPRSKAFPGSISPYLSPNTPPAPLSKAFPGSKPAFLRPQTLPGAACSGCRSGAGARSTQCCHADSGKPRPLQPFGSACPSARSGCAVPCGPSRSQARVPSLPGPVNPAPCAPGQPCLHT